MRSVLNQSPARDVQVGADRDEEGRRMRRTRSWRWLRVLGGLVILRAVVRLWGVAPFMDAARGIDVRLLVLATGVAAVTTLCAAWRWTLVARGLGTELPLATAVAGCYRSQLLNSTLPGGVLGDVHRGLRHGPVIGGAGLALRTVWWERSAGQAVQLAITGGVLLVVPSPLRPPAAVVVPTGVVLVLMVVAVRRMGAGSSRVGAAVRTVLADVRCAVLGPAWPGVLVASVVVVAGHWVTFVLAARAVDPTVSLTVLLPVGLVVLVASGLPVNVAGWGPREGAGAWAFGVAGLGAAHGVASAAVYGVLALVATAPGLVVLAGDALRGSSAWWRGSAGWSGPAGWSRSTRPKRSTPQIDGTRRSAGTGVPQRRACGPVPVPVPVPAKVRVGGASRE
jgi:hypothetical protein